VFLVPIFQSPDEDTHLDFALLIYEHGGLLVARQLPPTPDPYCCHHPYILYLRVRTNMRPVVNGDASGMPAGYGSPAFYEALDRDAPPRERDYEQGPFLQGLYPFGYYAMLAGWLHLVR